MSSQNSYRLDFFSGREGNRYWWFQMQDYLPDIIQLLTEAEFEVLKQWYIETDEKRLIGECNIPIMSEICGIINGSGISNIVQLGHYSGWSTLFLGWCMRRMGKKNSIFTVDIDQTITNYTSYWVKQAGLQEYVTCICHNSTDKILPGLASSYFGDNPIEMMFIDSSHEYNQTMDELDLWYPHIAPNGLIILHDAGEFAQDYDKTALGGVNAAFKEWTDDDKRKYSCEYMIVNEYIGNSRPIRLDKTGMGIIQKPGE